MSWLDELKVGDEVFVSSRYYKKIKIITKITPKTIVIENNIFNKSNGQQRGGDVYKLHQVTPESKAEFLEEQAKEEKIYWVKNRFSRFNNDQLIKIYDLLHQPKGEKK